MSYNDSGQPAMEYQLHTREFTAKDAKDAKETNVEALTVFIENRVSGSVIFLIKKHVFYFASLASFAVRLYRTQITLSIRIRTNQ